MKRTVSCSVLLGSKFLEVVGDEAEKDGGWICFIRRGTGFYSAGNGQPLKHSWQERSEKLAAIMKNVRECKIRKRRGMRTPKRVAVVKIQQIFTELLLHVKHKIPALMALSAWRWTEEIYSRNNHQVTLSKNNGQLAFILRTL